MADKESTIKTIFALDGETKYRDAIKNINSEQRELRSELSKATSAYQLNGDKLEYNKSRVEILTKQYDSQKRKLDEVRHAMEQSAKINGENSEETRKLRTEYNNTESALMRMEKSLKDATAELAAQELEMRKLGNRTREVGEAVEKTGAKMKGFGDGMSKYVTAPLVGIGVAATAAFMEVDENLDNIAKATGATGKNLEELQDVWENVVRTMPVDMGVVSEAVGELNTQFGWTNEKLEENTRLTAKYIEITGAGVTETIQGTKKALEIFGLEADKYEKILEIVAKQAQDTGVDTKTMFDAIARGGPTLKNMGLSLEESVVLLSQMEQNGIEATRALGYLVRAQATLAKEGKPLNQGLQEFQDIVKNSTSETEKMNEAAKIFGTKGAVTMLDAVERGALDFGELADAAESAGGTIARTFEDTLDPIDQHKVLLNNAKIAGAKLSEEVQIALAPAMESLIDVVSGAVDGFNSLDDKTKKTITNAGLIVAAIGPAMSVGGRVVELVGKGISGWGGLIDKLSMAPGVIGNVTTALGSGGTFGLVAGVGLAGIGIWKLVESLTAVDPAVKRAQESLESLDDEFRDMEAGYLAQTELIKQYRGDLDTLMQEEDKSVATKRRIQSVVERLNQLVPELNLAYDEQADKLNMTVTEMDKLILSSREAVKEQLKQELVTKLLEEEGKQLEDLIKYQIELEELAQSRQAIEDARNAALMTGLTEEQLKYAEMTKEAREYHGVTLDLADEQVIAIGKLKNVIEEEADRLERATGRKVTNFVASTNALNELDGATRRTQKSSDELAGIYEGMGPRMEEYEKALDKTLDSVLGLKDTQDDLGDATEDSAERQTEAIKKMAEETIPVWEQLGMSQEEYEKAVDDHAKKIEDRTAENVKRLSNFSDQKIDYEKITVKKFIELKQKELEAFTKYEDNLSTVSKRTSKEFADELRKMGDAAAPLIAKIATASDKELEELETVFKNRTKAATDAAKEELGQLPGVAENYVNSMIDAVDRKDEELKKAGYRIGSSLVGGTKRSVLMDSPSKVGIEIGENWDDSIAMGAEKALPRVKDAGRKVGDTLSAATLPTPQDLSMQLDVIRRVSTVGDYGAPVRVPVGGGVVGQPGTASVPALGASPVFNINVQVPYDESEDFGRRVGRMVMNELHSAEMSRGG